MLCLSGSLRALAHMAGRRDGKLIERNVLTSLMGQFQQGLAEGELVGGDVAAGAR